MLFFTIVPLYDDETGFEETLGTYDPEAQIHAGEPSSRLAGVRVRVRVRVRASRRRSGRMTRRPRYTQVSLY